METGENFERNNFDRNNYERRDNWGRGGDNQPPRAGAVRNGSDRGADPALHTNDRWQEPDKREPNAFYGGNNGRTIPRGGKSPSQSPRIERKRNSRLISREQNK